MADVVTKPVSSQILNKGRGQRTQLLTFRGEVLINTRWDINGTHGVATQVRTDRQQLSNGILKARNEADPTTNGHFTVTSDT